MDAADARCLLDVLCDPQALNDFLHGPEKIGSDDLLDSTGDAVSAFFEGAGLHMQESSGNQLSTQQSPPATSLDFDFLEELLGSPSGDGTDLQNWDRPCDILQQSLQEDNIPQQMLKAEAKLDLGPFQPPTLQPVVQAAPNGTLQTFCSGAGLMGLQQPGVLPQPALVQPSVRADVFNNAISVQPWLQPVGLGNGTIQPISSLQALPSSSPGGTLRMGPIRVVGQQVLATNQAPQQIIEWVQPSRVATVPIGSGITLPALPNPAPQQEQRVDRFLQVPQGIILQQPPTSQAAAALGQFPGPCSSLLVSGQGQAVRVPPTPTPAHGQAPAALPPPTADRHISSLCRSQRFSSSSFSSSSSSSSSSSLVIPASSSILPPSQSRKHPLPQPPAPIHPPKLPRRSGGSPSLPGAKAAPAPGSGDEEALPRRSKAPIQTPHEAQSRIRLHLRVRQEAGRIKVLHSRVEYPVFQRPARRRTQGPAPTAPAPAGT